MKQMSIRNFQTSVIVAVLAFLLGIATTGAWLIFRPLMRQPHTQIPDQRWVSSFFDSEGFSAKPINRITREANLPNLNTVLLPDNDVEVRVWGGFGTDGKVYGVILRRVNDRWSVTHVHAPGKTEEIQMHQAHQALPKSGWDAAWGRLDEAGLLTLPDASEARCDAGAIDGAGFVVEMNVSRSYRTYMYANPQLSDCGEARQMKRIVEIIDEEYGWKDSEVKN